MKNSTNIIASSPNINGNIGSCEVKATQVKTGIFTIKTVATNSCTGQIISQNDFFDLWGIVAISLALVVCWTIFRKALKQIYESIIS